MTENNSDSGVTSEEKDAEAMVRGLEAVERRRRTRMLLAGLAVAAVAMLVLVLSFLFRDEVFQPKIDIEGGEKEVLSETNDPQCRAFIAEVTTIGEDYLKLEPRLEQTMLTDDADAIRELRGEIEALEQRLGEAEEKAAEANLRFDNSRTELEQWFDYVRNEFFLLRRLASERLAELDAGSESADAGGEAVGADAGTLVEKGGDSRANWKSQKTPKERLDGALLAANEAFQKFRVWHTGSLHPCGQAEPGETPWTPGNSDSEATSKGQ